MKNVIKYLKERAGLKRYLRSSMALIVALAIVAGLFWQLRLIGVAMIGEVEGEASVAPNPLCGMENHAHEDSCYIAQENVPLDIPSESVVEPEATEITELPEALETTLTTEPETQLEEPTEAESQVVVPTETEELAEPAEEQKMLSLRSPGTQAASGITAEIIDGTYDTADGFVTSVSRGAEKTVSFSDGSSVAYYPGDDTSLNNRVVRTFDTVTYAINWAVPEAWQGKQIKVSVTIKDVDGNILTLQQAKLTPPAGHTMAEQTAEGTYPAQMTTELVLGAETNISLAQFTVEPLSIANGTLLYAHVEIEDCEGGEDPITYATSEVVVSAYPRYRLLMDINKESTKVGTYDFATGDANAIGRQDPTIIEKVHGQTTVHGTMLGAGFVVQLYNIEKELGLKGIELPAAELSWNLGMGYFGYYPDSSYALYGDNTSGGYKASKTTPLIWDWRADTEDSGNSGNWGRNMDVNASGAAAHIHNTGPYARGDATNSCSTGANWTVTPAVSSVDGTPLFQTGLRLSDYTIVDAQGNYSFPPQSADGSVVYGENEGCIAAAYFQFLFPSFQLEDYTRTAGEKTQTFSYALMNLQCTNLNAKWASISGVKPSILGIPTNDLRYIVYTSVYNQFRLNSGNSTEQHTDLTKDDARITNLALNGMVDGTYDKENEFIQSVPQGEKMTINAPDGNIIEYHAGDDTSLNNRVVRTFDTVNYQVKYTTRAKTETASYKSAALMVQAVIPGCTMKEAKFQLENMLWLEKATQRDVIVNGKNYVVLTGYYIREANQNETAIPGDGFLTFIIKVQNMKNGASVSPEFYMWMEHNACAYDPVGNNSISFIYGSDKYFPEDVFIDPSNGGEFADVVCLNEGTTVYVSAAPKYNVKIARHFYMDDFADKNFSDYKKNDAAEQQEMIIENFMRSIRTPTEGEDISEAYYTSMYGRIIGVEVALQLYTDDKSKGFKGIELPDPDEPIMVELTVNSYYDGEANKKAMTSLTDGVQYTPLLWDYEAATQNIANYDSDGDGKLDMKVGELGRDMQQRQISSPATITHPANELNNRLVKKITCYNGGEWAVKQNMQTVSMENGTGSYYTNTFEIAVEGFEFADAEGNYHFPTNALGNPGTSPVFGEDLGTGCFSTGFLQILLPMPKEPPSGIDTSYYNAEVKLTSATSISGQTVSDSGSSTEGDFTYPEIYKSDNRYGVALPWGTGATSFSLTHDITGRWLDAGENYIGSSYTISAGSMGPFYEANRIEANSSRADDGWGPLGYDGVMWVRYDGSSTRSDEDCASAMNMFIKFDADGSQPVDIDERYRNSADGTLNTKNAEDVIETGDKNYPWVINQKMTINDDPFDLKVFYAALRDRRNWSDTGNAADVDEAMSKATMWDDDLVYYPSMKALEEAGETCVGVLVEKRGGFLGGRSFIGIPVKFTSDVAAVGKVFDMTSHTVAWSQAQDGAAMTFSETPGTGGCSWTALITLPASEDSDGDETETDTAGLPCSFNETVAMEILRNYSRAIYKENGTITGKDNTFYQRAYGSSYLIVGNYAYLTKTVANPQNGTSGTDCTLDIDKNHRTVNYTIEANAQMDNDENYQVGGTNETKRATIYIADLIPEKVTVLPNTEFAISHNKETITLELGADGEVSGVFLDGVKVTVNKVITTEETVIHSNTVPAGRTVLVYTFENAVVSDTVGTYLIEYSAEVGEPGGDEKTTEVKNTEQLTSTAWVRCTGDNRLLDEKVGNITSATFKIIKNGQSALLKKVEEPVVEVNAPITFNVIYNNMSSVDYDSYYILDVLPYSNDSLGSKFNGTYTVTDINFDLTNFEGELKVWYLTGERGSLPVQLDATNLEGDENGLYLKYVGENGAEIIKTFIQTEITQITDSDGKAIAIIENVPRNVIAIVFGGSLNGNKRIAMNVTIDPEQNHASDFYRNCATMVATMSDTVAVISPVASATVIQRIISGVAWIDVNANGIREKGEPIFKGIDVTLFRLNEAGVYERMKANLNGESLEGFKTDEDGAYRFDALPAGTYKVIFGTTQYIRSPEDQGTNDTIDSDAIQDETGIYIENIVLSELENLTGDIERSDHHDLGLWLGETLPMTGGNGVGRYYVFGGCLMIFAAFVWIFRKKRCT